MTRPLTRDFYDRDTVVVARELLGAVLIRCYRRLITAGRIVEVEAYVATGDSANHAHRGRTRKNASMFGPPGHAYVYPIHARYCLNTVTQPEGTASAVLIRAVEPLEGITVMARRRGTDKPLNLCRGPARLCEAFAIDRALDGWDLTRSERLWITEGQRPASDEIATSPRIGVTSAHDLPLRFFVRDCRYVCRSPKR